MNEHNKRLAQKERRWLDLIEKDGWGEHPSMEMFDCPDSGYYHRARLFSKPGEGGILWTEERIGKDGGRMIFRLNWYLSQQGSSPGPGEGTE